jgi:hypothetical protein
MDSKEVQPYYKCRLCGIRFPYDRTSTVEWDTFNSLVWITTKPIQHLCGDGGRGIADFAGVLKVLKPRDKTN